MWPFSKPSAPAPIEHRAYTDALVDRIIAAAGAAQPDAVRTTALEIGAGVVGRAFASLVPEGLPAGAILRPHTLGAIGRDLLTQGEWVGYWRAGLLIGARHWVVRGRSPDEDEWSYRLEIPAPDRAVHRVLPGVDVVHVRYSVDASRPWEGVAPLHRATSGAALAAYLEERLSQEASGSVGYLLPIPADGGATSVAGLKSDLAALKGKTALVETTAAGWGEGRAAAPGADYRPQRIGVAPPQPVVALYEQSLTATLGALGVPIELVSRAEGTGQREAWRRCLHGTLEPLVRLLEQQLRQTLRAPMLTLSLDPLAASDIMGRARAFQSMVGGGMGLGEAAAHSGLLAPEG